MPTFATPQPIMATVEIVSGSVHLTASERDDTVVRVSPRDPNRASDVRVAESAGVDFANGTLTVTAGRRIISLGRGGAVIVDIELPSRSRVNVSSASAGLRADGDFGDCRLATASGDASIESVAGNLRCDSASGAISVAALAGQGSVSTASGDATFGELVGDITFRAASGSLSISRLRGTVNAQTASGDAAIAAAVSGEVSVQSGSGDTRVGVEEGTAAKLDLRTHSGAVRNSLQPSDGPVDGDETLHLRVKTGSGDIVVRRATATAQSQ
jgi:DUF4097 and DUF4098 domain-containing protein YvlB